MARKEVSDNYASNRALDALLALPVTNLEKRLHELEDLMAKRSELSRAVQTSMGSSIAALSGRLFRLRYQSDSAPSRETRQHLQFLETQRHRESLECFRDIAKLREDLRETRERLERSRLKQQLMRQA